MTNAGSASMRYVRTWASQNACALLCVFFGFNGQHALTQDKHQNSVSATPTELPATQLPKLIKALPSYTSLSLSGLAFFQDRLYVGSNLGIIEIQAGSVSKLLRFHRKYSVVSGVTFDVANQALWADDDETGDFIRFDGIHWVHISWPNPSKGVYTRGDVGVGLTLISNQNGLWLTLAAEAWQWDASTMGWRSLSRQSDPKMVFGGPDDNLVGVIPFKAVPLKIVRHQGRFIGGRRGQKITESDELVDPTNASGQVRRTAEPFLADTWTVAQDAGYICTTDHGLVRVTRDLVSSSDAPGECERVGNDSGMNLIVNIKGKGIYRYTQAAGWTLLGDSPYPNGEGEYWAYSASSHGLQAIAMTGKPVVAQTKTTAEHMSFTRNAPTSLWVLEQGKFEQVPLQ